MSRFKHLFLAICLLCHTFLVHSQETANDEIKQLIYEYAIKGHSFIYYELNFDSAKYYLQKALDLQYTTPGYIIDDRVAGNHVNLAVVYRKLMNRQKALNHLNKAEEILLNFDPQNPHFGTIYNNKGNIYKNSGDYFPAKQYYEYAINWIETRGDINSLSYYEIYSNYIDVLLRLNLINEAEEVLSSVVLNDQQADNDSKFRYHLLVGNSKARLGKTDEAIEEYMIAKEILNAPLLFQKFTKRYNLSSSLIELYLNEGMLDEAIKEIIEGLYYLETKEDEYSPYSRDFYTSLQYYNAYIQYIRGDYSGALRTIEGVFSLIETEFKEILSSEYLSFTISQHIDFFPELEVLKSRALFAQYEKSGSINYLEDSFKAYKKAIETLNDLKLHISDENSRVFATALILEVYHEAIDVGHDLYTQTGNNNYLEEAFSITESSKSFALYSEIKNVEAIEFSDLPNEIKDKEEELLGEIQSYEELLYAQQLSGEPDSSLIKIYHDKIFHLNDDYDELRNNIEVNYKQYFELKYYAEFISLNEIQEKLPYRDALIEYVLCDTILFTYVVDSRGINVISQEVGPEFSEECFEYYGLMYTQNFSNGVKQNYERYVELGRKFYNILVEPALQYTSKKNLTIVPDGAISYIPFEGLLTADADKNYINYLTLPYLVREYSIGYSHSATLMFSERLKTKSPEEKVLAFAPKYYNPLDNVDTSSIRQVINEGGFLLPLGGVIKEVQSIKETVPSRVFLNENATEANFRANCEDYNVLHLAMHTIMSDENPMHSLLAFTNVPNLEDTSGHDNKLYAYEIYNLKLNAQMAVLSSCSSGFGKMQKGEGMMSLARGFIYAGCPSIVMTLWQVSDKSSSELMTSFYKYLKKGKSKQEAMRLAKIDYLETADDLTSNPYFWSGFVVLGDSEPIYRKSGMTYYVFIIILFIGILVFFQVKKK